MQTPRELLQYQTASGHIPFEEWIKSLIDPTARRQIRLRIDRLTMGNWSDFKNVGGSIFELRIHWGPGYRVYFGLEGSDFVILLSGGSKNRQSDDIHKAQTYWQDYKRRKNETARS